MTTTDETEEIRRSRLVEINATVEMGKGSLEFQHMPRFYFNLVLD